MGKTEQLPQAETVERCQYLGGFADLYLARRGGDLAIVFDESGVRFELYNSWHYEVTVTTLGHESISGLDFEGPSSAESRVGAFGLMGVILWWRKAHKVAYLKIASDQGEGIFEVRGELPIELRARLAAWIRYYQGFASASMP